MESLQDKINQFALIVRKYNLGDKDYFISHFPNLANSKLEIGWTFAQNKIQNKEIIKNASRLTVEEDKLAILKTNAFDNKSIKLYEKLNSRFDAKELKLTDENIERKVRHILALRFLGNLSNEIKELEKVEPKSFKPKVVRFINKIKYGLIALAIVGVFSVPRIIDGLTPIETLTIKIHDRSKYEYRVGATCNDGWNSGATGQGACSHHGGVSKWIYETAYHKTMDECRQEAEKKSWLD